MVNFVSQELKLDFNDVQIVPSFSSLSSRKDVNLNREFHMIHSNELLTTNGVIAANMDGVGTMEVAHVLRQHNVMTALHKNYSAEELIQFFQEGIETEGDHASDLTFYSMGIREHDFDKLKRVMKQTFHIPRICIDVANGYMEDFQDFIKLVRDCYPMTTIMAGNVVTPEAVIALHNAGADIVKLGIGPGAVCTTRLVTGVGYPQFSCIVDSVQAADECGVYLCSDGGCVTSGDVSKAIAAGSDFVMLGSMLAGTVEGGGEHDVDSNTVTFYGMSSATANDKHFGGLKKYRSSEGRTVKIPYKGLMEPVVQQILGGLASTCTYTGSRNLSDLQYNAKFIKTYAIYNKSLESYTIGF